MARNLFHHPKKRHPAQRGFALVVTISLMVLLALLAVGMLGLSSVTLRTAGQSSAQAEAQANARVALILAIGELQKQMGPDQRISANASILPDNPESNARWVGVWDSWIAESTDSAPVTDNYPPGESHHSTLGEQPVVSMRPEYDKKFNGPKEEGYFRRWLVSLSAEEAATVTSPAVLDLTPSPGDGDAATVQLVSQGSLGESARPGDYVNARLINIYDDGSGKINGRYGWWVGDESQKARIMADSYLPFDRPAANQAEGIYRSQAPASMNNTAVAGLENIGDAGQQQLGFLPSLLSLDLVSDVVGRPAENFHVATPYSFQVLADVREGGLKRDLNTILERPIQLAENGDEFMLYRFDTTGEERVPIQDLAAYYQLYKSDPVWEVAGQQLGGMEHKVNPSRVMQIRTPDYGNNGNRDKLLRQYTAAYRNPVPIKVQFVLGVGAKEMTDWERIQGANNRQGSNSIRDTDRYKLLLGIKPVVTLWNPSNVPLVMGTDASQIMKVGVPPFSLRWKKYRADDTVFESNLYLNMNAAGGGTSTHKTGNGDRFYLYMVSMQFARDAPIVFQPGEVKMFSVPINPLNFLESGGDPDKFGNKTIFQAEEFTPDGFFVIANSALWEKPSADTLSFSNGAGYTDVHLVFGDGDKLDLQVAPETRGQGSTVASCTNEVRGSALQFFLQDPGYHTGTETTGTAEHFRNYQFISRFGFWSNSRDINNVDFNHKLTLSGFPEKKMIPYDGKIDALPVDEILAATAKGEAKALLSFSMTAACEKGELYSGGGNAGRRTVSRPFLHGAVLKAPQISGNEPSDLYEYGWEWQVNKINSLDEAFHDDGNSRGFYGGGYTSEDGVSHVVQQYLPALPPISIASLSNARLGGYSLANAPAMSTKDANVIIGKSGDWGNSIRNAPAHGDFRQVTATGQGGLNPHTMQAVGNAYAHPNIPANQAFTTFTQILNADRDESNPPVRPYVDHSYLANKALWDEFFFSSITPQSSAIPLYGGSNKTATEVADAFLFSDGVLPNRRFVPYRANLSPEAFNTLKAQYPTYTDGFADKIAAHMLFAGPFNINSTSVEAWKVLFSSLKGKPLPYLKDQASELSSVTLDGTPATPGMLANATPIQSSSLSRDANTPPEQWTSSRSLSDREIEDLAAAMVHQVKLRGPFLSLSEFINRRLDADSSNTALALKGALQAALDFEGDSTLGLPEVTINAAFRTPERSLDSEIAGMNVASSQANQAGFPEALQGPVAYGSTPYVDQADILRHLGSALTPRGDTFVIRTYGDSLDAQGKVQARAWCEAVVQRVPDYVDSTNEPQIKQADSALSSANRMFGRQFQILKFRWLNADEV